MDAFLTALEAVLDAKSQGAPRAPGPAQPPIPPVGNAAHVSDKRVRAAQTPPPPAPAPPVHAGQSDGGLLALFEDGKSLVRALVAAEVLGPPIALREPSLWSQPPNERST